MKFKYKVNRTINLPLEILDNKITIYLKTNSYRIVEKGLGYIIFVEDEFSDRRKSRYDFHTRIGEGKFIFNYLTDNETSLELIYFTSLTYFAFLVMLVCAFGIYLNVIIMPIVMSCILTLPIMVRILYLNEHVFAEIMEC